MEKKYKSYFFSKTVNENKYKFEIAFTNHYFEDRKKSKNISLTRFIKEIKATDFERIFTPFIPQLLEEEGKYNIAIEDDIKNGYINVLFAFEKKKNSKEIYYSFVIISGIMSDYNNISLKYSKIPIKNRLNCEKYILSDFIKKSNIETKIEKKKLKIVETKTSRKKINIIKKIEK